MLFTNKNIIFFYVHRYKSFLGDCCTEVWLTYYGQVDTKIPGGRVDEVHSASEHALILHTDIVHLQARWVHARSLEVRPGSQVVADERVVSRFQAPAASIQTEVRTQRLRDTFLFAQNHLNEPTGL
jgi:hypothetical protein